LKNILPPSIQAGVTFERCVALPDYPATAGWVLSAVLRGPAVINLAAEADGDGHKFLKLGADTSGWVAGTYAYVVRATKDGDVRQVEAAGLEILADLATVSAPTDARSPNRIALEAINAVLAKRATLDQERYVIEGQNGRRELWRTPVADLIKLQGHYAALVRAEEARKRGKSLWGPAVRVRFP
jgi:hypothetical protein